MMRPQIRDGKPTGEGVSLLALAVLLAAALAAGCGDDVVSPEDPPQFKSTAELTFLRPAEDAPPLLLGDSDGDGIRDTSFVATRGENLEVEIFYEDRDTQGERGDRFLEFELEEESLFRYPDGREFQPGDTVTITIQVAGDTLLAEFEPDGLEFDPDEPAELEMRWIEAETDVDDDGEEDEEEFDLWKQEREDEPWERSGDLKDVDRDRIRALIRSFTRWALAV